MLDADRALRAAAEMDRINAYLAAAVLWGQKPSAETLARLTEQFEGLALFLIARHGMQPEQQAEVRASLERLRALLADWQSQQPEDGPREALESFLRPEDAA
jgi:hypothetical protein